MDTFITGLARSRTAWCANFLTTGEFRFAHDGLLGCPSLDAFEHKMRGYTGDSDSALAVFAPELMARYPEARWIVLLRDPEAVVRSLVAMEPYPGMLGTEAEARMTVEMGVKYLDALCQNPGVTTLQFDELGTEAGLRKLWWASVGDRAAFPVERAQFLQGLRVTVIPSLIPDPFPAMRSLVASL